MRAQDNEAVDFKKFLSVRILGLPGATLLALTLSPQLWAAEPIIVVPPHLEAVSGWIGPNGGNWNQAGNWHNGIVPGQGQNRENVDLFDFDTDASGGSYNLNKLTGSGRLTITGVASVIHLAVNSQLGSLTQARSSIGGPGDLIALDDTDLFAARFFGSGATILQGNTSITGIKGSDQNRGGLMLDSGRILRNENLLTWSGGLIDLNGRHPNLDPELNSGVIENSAGAQFIASGGGYAGNVLDDDGPMFIIASNSAQQGFESDDGSDAGFINHGIFRKTGSAADHVTSIGVNFVNTGTVEVETGFLDLNRGGEFSGVVDLSSGAELRFNEGQYALNGGEIKGAGKVKINGDSLILFSLEPATVEANPPTVVKVNTDSRIANLDFNNGIIDLVGGVLTVGNFSQQRLSHVRGSLDLIVTSDALLTGGSHIGSGRTILKGNSQVTGSLYLDGGRALINEGQLTWNAGQIQLNDADGNFAGAFFSGGASLVNAAGASFVIHGDDHKSVGVVSVKDSVGATQTQFTNQGTLLKTASTADNITAISANFTNVGLIDVETGKLQFNQPFINHGQVQVHDAAQLAVNVSDLLNETDGSLSGDGSYALLRSAQLINKGNVNPGIDGTGHLTVFGDYVQTDTGKLQIELAGLDAFDTLNVQGLVDLGGTLQIFGLNGYKPNVGDSFIVMSYLGTLGSTRQVFDHIQWSGFNPTLAFDVSYLNNAVTLTVSQVPLPGGFALFASGGLLLLGIFRKNSTLQPGAAVLTPLRT